MRRSLKAFSVAALTGAVAPLISCQSGSPSARHYSDAAGLTDAQSRIALGAARENNEPVSASASSRAIKASAPLTPAERTRIGRLDRLSVMSFNMKHKDRPRELATMADALRTDIEETPDFILLQEVMFNRSKRKGEANTAAVLANELDYFCRGTKRSSDREGVAIISRYPFLYYAECHHEAQTSRLLLGFNRVSVMGEFTVPDLGRVRVVNVHYTNWGFESRIRRKQLTETLQWIAARQKDVPADIIVLGGDFNIEPDWDELQLVNDVAVTGGIKYASANNPRTETFGLIGRASKRIDYIFIAEPTRHCDVENVSDRAMWEYGLTMKGGNDRFHLSDHLPVLQEFRVNTAIAHNGTDAPNADAALATAE